MTCRSQKDLWEEWEWRGDLSLSWGGGGGGFEILTEEQDPPGEKRSQREAGGDLEDIPKKGALREKILYAMEEGFADDPRGENASAGSEKKTASRKKGKGFIVPGGRGAR